METKKSRMSEVEASLEAQKVQSILNIVKASVKI